MTLDELENTRDFLRNSVLRDLPPRALDTLAGTVQIRVVAPNEIIYKEGEPPEAFYIVGSGRVRVFVRHKNRIEREFSIRGPGDNFGEVSLLSGEPHTANVESLEETCLIVLSKEQFDSLLLQHPDLTKKFVREMHDWLIEDQRIIEEETDALIRSSRVSWFDFVLVIGVSVLLGITLNFSNPNGIAVLPERPDPVPSIGVQAVMQGYGRDAMVIVDAMPANFYQDRHICGAVNIPTSLFDIMYLVTLSDEDKEKEIVVYGNTISRPYDLEIADKLLIHGFKNVKVLDGGLQAWEANGYPVEQKGPR